MSQRDVVLRIPLCTLEQIQTCNDPVSKAKLMKTGSYSEFEMVVDDGQNRPKHICEVAVPGSCPRVQCFDKKLNKFMACRMQAAIQAQVNADGFWMKLPCATCDETRDLHPITEGFVYAEDTTGN